MRHVCCVILVVIAFLNQIWAQSLLSCFFQPLDASCPEQNLHFWLYSGSSQEGEEINVEDPLWIFRSRYNATLPTVMLVHGNGGGEDTPIITLKQAYQKRGTHNVIMVDWGDFAQEQCYFWSVWNVPPVSKCIAHMLMYLRTAGVKTERITCIGHSLGAHVCGIIANFLPYKMDKIVGLDPARPLMQYTTPEERLDKSDAKIVQVIHSNTGFYGLSGMQGSADFCINNGVQPFCQSTQNSQVCSHLQAICFYAASLFPSKAKQGVPCERLCPTPLRNNKLPGHPVTMGEYMEKSAKGMYCVTALDPPYCFNSTVDPEFGDSRCCPL